MTEKGKNPTPHMTAEQRRYHATKHVGTELQCQEIKKDGDRCPNHVISVQAGKDKFYGTRCSRHGGPKEKRRLVQQLQQVKLRNIAKKVGTPIEIEPTEAMVQQVWEAAGNVAYYREKVRMLQVPIDMDPRELYPELFAYTAAKEEAPKGPNHLNGTDFTPNSVQVERFAEEMEEEARRSKGTLWGPDHLGDLAPHVLLKFYNDERDRLVRYVKICVELGIAERHQRLAEGQMKMMAHILLKVLENPGLSLSSEQVIFARKAAATMLREYAAQAQGRLAALAPPATQAS